MKATEARIEGNITVKKSKVILVEGKEDKGFIASFLKHLGVEDFQVEFVGGKGEFKKKIPLLIRNASFSLLKYLVVLQDADENAVGAFQSIANIFKRDDEAKEKKLTPPAKAGHFSKSSPKVGIFILPNNKDKGMIEDLCLSTVEENPAMNCVSQFIQCVKTLEKKPNNWTKAKVQAYLSAMPRTLPSLGEAAAEGYWNFEAETLKQLNSFLKKLR